MIGQFFFPTCEVAGLRVRAFLRNTPRTLQTELEEGRRQGVAVDLRVFELGRLKFHDPTFGHIPLGGVLEISEDTCPGLTVESTELLIVARCSLSDNSEHYFPQEHQLLFQSRLTGIFGSLLYDQLPLSKASGTPSPIIVLAPKAWVGTRFNSYVVFANATNALDVRKQSLPLTISVLTADGRLVVTCEYTPYENSVLVFDVRTAVQDCLTLTDEPAFFNVVARGGASNYTVMTFVVNEMTGNFALEHSLSPGYYVGGDLARVRREALLFPTTRG